MTSTALRRPAAVPVRPVRPRLLLPPAAESSPELLAREASDLLAGSVTRSVRSPVTEALWPVQTPAPAPMPDPHRLAGSVVLAAVECLAGGRPVLQLARWVSPSVYESLSRRCPPPTGRPPARRPTVRAAVVSRLSVTVAEASVVLHDGDRVRAAAVRLEAHRGAWRVTVLQIG